MTIIIKNATIINYNKITFGNILINNEKIESIGTDFKIQANEIIDATGKYVIPGAIDVHTHLDMPFGETTSSDDFETGTIAAALGGTTSIIDFAIQDLEKSLDYSLEIWMAKAEKKAAIDYGFHCIIRKFNDKYKNEMLSLVNKGVTSFKLFTAYPGIFMMNDGNIFRIMQYAGKIGASISVHAENGHVINVLIEQALKNGNTSPRYHAITRPANTEAEAVHRIISLADMAHVPVYIVHLSSAEGLDEVIYAKSKNKKVFAETCPQYLFLSNEKYEEQGFNCAKYVMSPPLRSNKRQEDLWKGIKDDNIQVIATDHCPFFFKNQKHIGFNDFTKIPNGIPAIETRLGLIYNGGVLKNRFSLQKWIDVVSTAPAKLFGIYPQKGIIKEHSDADIVIFNPNDKQKLNAKNLHMNVDYSPYEKTTINGTSEIVILRGKIIVKDKKFIGKKGYGNFLKRKAGTMQNNI